MDHRSPSKLAAARGWRGGLFRFRGRPRVAQACEQEYFTNPLDMSFFDFHVHPTLKSLFGDDTSRLDPWKTLDIRLIPNLLRWCSEFKYILRSQANLRQLIYNECKLVCIALHAPERYTLDNSLILKNAERKLSAYLSSKKIRDIISNTITPYDLIITEDLPMLFDPARFGISDRKVVALTKASDFDETNEKTLYAVFSVEGCHTLSRSALPNITSAEVIQNLDDLRTRVKVLAVNLTHMQQSPLCNHAYGMQFLQHDSFKPTGRGLSAEGARVVKHCYENNIMIDIKHMSLVARRNLYDIRKGGGFGAVNRPIICTHAGFTGISWEKISDYIYSIRTFSNRDYIKITLGKRFLNCSMPRPSFNTASINLFDEDILQILSSDGIIGLSLDKRILGYADLDAEVETYTLEVEYISKSESKAFFESPQTVFKSNLCIENKEVDQGGRVNPSVGEYHLRHFMAQIIHIIKVCRREGYDVSKALHQICIGSDFDGMINPIWICDTFDNLQYFRETFEERFVDFADDCGVALPAGFDVKSFSTDLFYKNGRDFVLARL